MAYKNNIKELSQFVFRFISSFFLFINTIKISVIEPKNSLKEVNEKLSISSFYIAYLQNIEFKDREKSAIKLKKNNFKSFKELILFFI